jgi:putative nucleotidyltransferase with HDIG domain
MIADYTIYVERFRNYVNSTGKHDDFIQEHLDLKVQHTFRVTDNIIRIARESGYREQEVTLAKLIALLHDIGRFEQFIQYKTFDDRQSVNHAEFGVQILQRTGFLDELTDEVKTIIYGAILNHNTSRLDPGLDMEIARYARLIRDADKVDIWYILTLRDVVNVILEKPLLEEAYTVPQHITDSYLNGKVVPHAISMNDYRLLRLSWIYDMNFQATYSLVLKRGYIPKILAKIPNSTAKEKIAEIIYQYVNHKAGMQVDASRPLK